MTSLTKKTAPPNQKFCFIANYKTCQVFWALYHFQHQSYTRAKPLVTRLFWHKSLDLDQTWKCPKTLIMSAQTNNTQPMGIFFTIKGFKALKKLWYAVFHFFQSFNLIMMSSNKIKDFVIDTSAVIVNCLRIYAEFSNPWSPTQATFLTKFCNSITCQPIVFKEVFKPSTDLASLPVLFKFSFFFLGSPWVMS